MLGDVANDKIKMTQIEKFYNQAVEESKDEIPCEINQVVSKPVIVPAVLPTKTPNITISNPVVSKSIRISTEPKKPPPPPVLKCSSSAPLATKQTPRSANNGRVVINTSRTVNVKPLEVPRTLPERPKTVAPNIRPSRPLNGPGLSASKRPATTNDLSRLQPTSTTSRLQPTSVQNNIHGSKLQSCRFSNPLLFQKTIQKRETLIHFSNIQKIMLQKTTVQKSYEIRLSIEDSLSEDLIGASKNTSELCTKSSRRYFV
uniref:Uncharacterized protein n=1 Tax=Panagrolaimus sp. JU765 TaxID=591449 RepID=A0AC34Q9U4_9BILA